MTSYIHIARQVITINDKNNAAGIYAVWNRRAVAPFTNMVLTLILAWISNHLPDKVWVEIDYLFLNFNDATVEV